MKETTTSNQGKERETQKIPIVGKRWKKERQLAKQQINNEKKVIKKQIEEEKI